MAAMLQRRAAAGLWRAALVQQLPSTSSFSSSAAATAAEPSPSFNGPTESRPQSFYARDIQYELATPQPRVNLEDLKFGTCFTDHMFLAEHTAEAGWGQPAIKPFGFIPLHPAAQVLHYGMCCFEGMKAYQGVDGRARLFRPDMNMARFHRSSQRLQLAEFDPQELLECIKELLRVDRAWLPAKEGYSIYIRPFMFSSAHVLGVAKTTRSMVSVVLSPVGPYFPTGLRPISLFVDELHRRAWPGGVGDVKVGGNYAPTIQPQVEAAAAFGTQQVLYTLNPTHTPFSEEAVFAECGAMNMFFLLEQRGGGRELVTPRLDGTILPGVTRDSILQLARGWGEFEVSERQLTLREVKEAAKEGRLLECFGAGTACIVQPVGVLLRANGDVMTAQYQAGDLRSVALRAQRQLLDIQYGRQPHPWSVAIE
ncbi:hypothetical protein N2152v2_006909 [Parachlorella kessleri]